MSRPTATRTGISALVCALTFTAAAHADVTIEQRVAVEGTGAMAMANMSGTTTMAISGDRSRTDNNLQMQSRMVRMFARGAGETSEIVRLDRDSVYQLNPKKKQYTQTSLADMRTRLATAMEQAKQAQASQASATGMDESDCEWSQPQVDLKKTGATAVIAGYNAEQTLITATQSCKNRKTGDVCEMRLSLDEWLAADFDGGGGEVSRFQQAYAGKMGFSAAATRDTTERAEAMFGRYKGMWAELADKMKGRKGYPVRTSFALAFGGAQCGNAREATNLPPPPPPGSMGEAAATAAGQAVGEAAAAKAGGSAMGGMVGQLGGKIAGSLFKKRQKQKEPAAEPAPTAAADAPADGMVTPIRIVSELVAVRKDPIPAETFEVPADFRKVADDK